MNFNFSINKNKLSDSIIFNIENKNYLANVITENLDFSAFCFNDISKELFSIKREGLFFEMNYITNFYNNESAVATRVNELYIPRLIMSFRENRFGLEGNEDMTKFRLFDVNNTYALFSLSFTNNLVDFSVDYDNEDLFLFILANCFCIFDLINLMRGRI